MRKYFLGLFSLAMAICFNLLQSNKPIPKESRPDDQTSYDWYPVVNNEITSTTPLYTNMTKSAVVAVDECKDDIAPNCLFGTNGPVEEGQNIVLEPLSQRIRQQD